MNERILLSPPDVGPRERELLLDAFDSNWIAPLGPHVDALEAEFSDYLGGRPTLALSSGTAALHLALMMAGASRDSVVLTSTLTFAATANAITYTGAQPVFIDSDTVSWNMDPALLDEALSNLKAQGTRAAAVVAVDLYGQAADYDRLNEVCDRWGVPLIADAAESLGATHNGQPTGTQTEMALFSFNGNKIITTSGGGLLIAPQDKVDRARYLSTQARQPALHYEHTEHGYNYRMSNLLAAVGRGQLESLPGKVAHRRRLFERYEAAFHGTDLIEWMPEAPFGESTRWLTVGLLNPEATNRSAAEVCQAMQDAGIETRPAWKPMHLQPVFAETASVGGAVSEDIFDRGICLPSGSSLTDAQQDRVTDTLKGILHS